MSGASEKAEQEPGKSLAVNRRARHDYFIDDVIEAGIVLQGTEIRSLRAGHVQMREAYARVERGELFLFGMHISPYAFGNRWNHDPIRPRKLLVHKDQIDELWRWAHEGGRTLVPMRIYLNKNGLAKVEIGLGRGKHAYDKRESIAARDQARDLQRTLSGKPRW